MWLPSTSAQSNIWLSGTPEWSDDGMLEREPLAETLVSPDSLHPRETHQQPHSDAGTDPVSHSPK